MAGMWLTSARFEGYDVKVTRYKKMEGLGQTFLENSLVVAMPSKHRT